MRVERGYFDEQRSMKRGGALISAELSYFVFECDVEEQGALEAVRAVAEPKIQNLRLKSIEIDERLADETYKVRATYEADESENETQNENDAKFAFDTGGATLHRNYSLATVSITPSIAPNFQGAIEVDSEGNVNGVDVTMSSMQFTETHVFSAGRISTSYKKRVAALTGKVNSGPFRGYDAGEVLFLGASGSRNGDDPNDLWEVTFKFAVSPNRRSIRIGNITVPFKEGWDYMWVRYLDTPKGDNTAIEKTPKGVYVEQVYERANLRELGI